MTITVTEDWRNQNIEARADDNLIGTLLSSQAFFIVTVDENVTTQVAKQLALTAPGIPIVYQPHPSNPWLFVGSVRVDVHEGPKTFIVTVSYQALSDPISLPADISWTHATTNEPIDVDGDGNPITNSSDQPFDPPVTDDVDDAVRRYRVNWENFDHNTIARYINSTNSDTFLGFPPGTCKIVEFNGTRLRTGAIFYWDVLNIIHVRLAGWKKEKEDTGTREFVGTKTITHQIPDPAGGDPIEVDRIVKLYRTITETLVDENEDEIEVAVTEPVKLDGEGKILAQGDPSVFLTFTTKPSIPFNVLGIT